MKTATLLNGQLLGQLAPPDKYLHQPTTTPSVYWLYAVVLGSVLQFSLFIALPLLAPKPGKLEMAKPIEVDFVNWSTPVQKKAQHATKVKPKPKPKLKPKPKIAPKPVAKTQVTTPAPAKPEPELTATAEPITTPPEPAPAVEAAIEPSAATSAAVEESLPTPIPEYMVSEYPSYLHEDPGVYPVEMRALGREAIVGLAILIDKQGNVRKITVTQSQGEAFDRAAREKIQRSSFLPGKSEGKAVTVLLHEKVRFQLR